MSNQETLQTPDLMDDFSPLDQPVKQRSYTNHHIYDDAQVVEDLAEPVFQQPNFNDFDAPADEGAEPSRPFNESYSELDGKEKTMGAEMMAEMTLDLYTKGCGFIGKIPEISEAKLDRLIAEGDIDPSIQIPTEGGHVGVKDFAQEFNSSIKGAFEVDDEFREKVRQPLIRVFKKRGIGMTDEQLLAYYFGTDILTRGAQAFMLKKTANSILDSLKENTMAMREQQAPRPRPVAPEQVPQEENISYYEEIEKVEPVTTPKRATKRANAKTNLEEQLQHFGEPEEQGVYSNLKDTGGFQVETPTPSGMPEFGNVEILSELERISSESTPSTKRKRTTLKKPRGKK